MKIKKASLRVTAIIFALVAKTALAETYALVFDSKCSSSGAKLEFVCKSDPAFWAQNTTIFLRDGKWLGIEGTSKKTFPLSLVGFKTEVQHPGFQ